MKDQKGGWTQLQFQVELNAPQLPAPGHRQ